MRLAPLQRLANIRDDERLPVLVAALAFFCILTALMLLRPAREALGMQRGIEAIRWLFVGTVVVTLLVNPLFALLVSRWRRTSFLAATYGFFIVGLLGFHALLVLSPSHVGERSGQVFYVWFSVFNLFATMLFWALMADRFSLAQGKRLFAVIGVGGTLGAIFGPWLASVLAPRLGTAALLPVAAGFLLLGLLAALWFARLPSPRGAGAAGDAGAGAGHGHAVIGGSAWDGFRAVARSRYLQGICAYVLVLAVMATFIYFTRLQMVAALGTDLDMRTSVFARIDVATQVATLILQASVAGHLMKRLGVSFALAVLPAVAALGFVGLALAGSIVVLVLFEATFRALQRGLMRPARETLFTVASRADRYKAKAFIDTVVYRFGDVTGAQLEGLLGRLGVGLAALAGFAVPLALAWLALGAWLGYAQKRRSAEEGATGR